MKILPKVEDLVNSSKIVDGRLGNFVLNLLRVGEEADFLEILRAELLEVIHQDLLFSEDHVEVGLFAFTADPLLDLFDGELHVLIHRFYEIGELVVVVDGLLEE